MLKHRIRCILCNTFCHSVVELKNTIKKKKTFLKFGGRQDFCYSFVADACVHFNLALHKQWSTIHTGVESPLQMSLLSNIIAVPMHYRHLHH